MLITMIHTRKVTEDGRIVKELRRGLTYNVVGDVARQLLALRHAIPSRKTMMGVGKVFMGHPLPSKKVKWFSGHK